MNERNINSETTRAIVAQDRNALAPRQGLSFNGYPVSATATLGSAIGASDASIEFEIDVPNANPSAVKTAFHLASGRSEGTAYEIALTLLTSGQLIFFFRGATGGDSRYAGVTSNLVTTWGGQRIKGMITRTGATLAIKINDVTVAYTEVTAGTPPAWSAAWTGILLTLGQHGVSYSWDGFLAIRIWNRLLTATEQTHLYQNGAPAAGDYRDPAQPFGTSIITGANSDFSAAGAWNRAANVSLSGGKQVYAGAPNNYATVGTSMVRGKRYRLTVDIDANAGNVVVDDGGTALYGTLTGTGTKTLDFTATGTLFEIYATATATIDNVLIYPIGLLCAPESNAPGNGLVWNDRSGNDAHILLPHVSGKMTGVTWALPGGGRNSVSGTTNTLGNQQIFGAGSVVFDAVGGNPTCRIARVFARARTGTPSVTLGYTSGGNQYATATTLAVGWKVVAAGAESIAATTSLWAGSSSADVVEWMVMIEPIKF